MLILEDIEKSFQNNYILKGVSAEFQFGQCYLLLGANGAGKSTLAKCIAGDTPIDKGAIRLEKQRPVADLTVIQYQFFDSYSFLKVKEVIHLFSRLIKKPANIEELYHILDIALFEQTLIKNTSGGQRKALSLYLSFLYNKRIVLLDEPFADLDLKKKKQLHGFLRDQVEKKQICLLIISHEVTGLETFFDYVYIMQNGKFIERGTPEELESKYQNANFKGLEGVYFEVTGQVLGGRFS